MANGSFKFHEHRTNVYSSFLLESFRNRLKDEIEKNPLFSKHYTTKIKTGNVAHIFSPESEEMIFGVYFRKNGTFLFGIPETDPGRIFVYEDWIMPVLRKLFDDNQFKSDVEKFVPEGTTFEPLVDVID
jgi:hypothetical protein